jgi:hypothetical protein
MINYGGCWYKFMVKKSVIVFIYSTAAIFAARFSFQSSSACMPHASETGSHFAAKS